jgi:hypothetical protein
VIIDYRPYFKPVLSYVEGNWTNDATELDEPFHSDRYHIDAKTWEQLHEKTRFLFASGGKNMAENLPYLPSKIMNMGGPEKDVPETANWEYTMRAVEIDGDMPLHNLRPARDILTQLKDYPSASTFADISDTRHARFQLNAKNSSTWFEGSIGREFMDELMEKIPGKDNYNANIKDYAMGELSITQDTSETLNAGYYSRYYAVRGKNASGRTTRKRGFNDVNLWAAQTTQPKVTSTSLNGGYGSPVCGLTSTCITAIGDKVSASMKANSDRSADDNWKAATFNAVSSKNCAIPEGHALAGSWESDTTYHLDEFLMCRWKVKSSFFKTFQNSWSRTHSWMTDNMPHLLATNGHLAEPAVKNPTCGILDPNVSTAEGIAAFKQCPREDTKQKWSYAIPCEILFMTPLMSWDPYKLPNKGCSVAFGRRAGETPRICSASAPYNGACDVQAFYMTP